MIWRWLGSRPGAQAGPRGVASGVTPPIPEGPGARLALPGVKLLGLLCRAKLQCAITLRGVHKVVHKLQKNKREQRRQAQHLSDGRCSTERTQCACQAGQWRMPSLGTPPATLSPLELNADEQLANEGARDAQIPF